MTPVHVSPGADFKNCCMRHGLMDGSERDYFFQSLIASSNQPLERPVNGDSKGAASAEGYFALAALIEPRLAAAQAHR